MKSLILFNKLLLNFCFLEIKLVIKTEKVR